MKKQDFLASLKSLKSLLQEKETYKKENYRKEKHSKDTKVPLPYYQNIKHSNISCTCKAASGEQKYLYTSQDEISYLLSKKDIALYSYPCPYEKGWHLTKSPY